MPQFLTIICTCSGSQSVSIEEMKSHPSGKVHCMNKVKSGDDYLPCDKVYQVADLLKCVSQGKEEFVAKEEAKQERFNL